MKDDAHPSARRLRQRALHDLLAGWTGTDGPLADTDLAEARHALRVEDRTG
jgi:hypothetical protein